VTRSALSPSRARARRVREGRPEPRWLSLETVLVLHAEQLDRFGGSHGVLNPGAVEAALARPRNQFLYRDDADLADLADLAAAYLVGLRGSHGFVDGNKRVGAAAMLVLLALNHRPLHVPPAELYALVMSVATKQVTEGQVATWIRERTAS
jgi:death-on-curing protein